LTGRSRAPRSRSDRMAHEPAVPLVRPQHRRTRPPRRRHDVRLGVHRALHRPRPHRRGARLGRRPDRHRLGAARHLHGGHRARGPHDHVQTTGRGAARLLAARPIRRRGRHFGPAQPGPGAGQHRQRPGRPRRLRRLHHRARPTLRPHPGVPAPGAAAVDRGGGHLRRRALPGHRLRPRAEAVRHRRTPAPPAVLRRCLRGRRGGRGGRGRRAAVLGRAVGGDRRTRRAAAAVERAGATRPPAAGVRPADHHRGARHQRAGVAGGGGEGRADGRGRR